MVLLHATAVAVEGQGVLLRGPSGAGKSDLALRLIDACAELIADDQTAVEAQGDGLLLSPPPTIAGKLEVRGLPIATLPFRTGVPLVLVVDLVAPSAVPRLPPHAVAEIAGRTVALVALAPFESSAPIKVRLAAAAAAGDNLRRHDRV